MSPATEAHPQEFGVYTEPLSEGEDDEDMGLIVAEDEENRAGLTKGQATAAIKAREEMLESRRASQAAKEKRKADGDDDVGAEADAEDEPIPPKPRQSSIATSQRPRRLSIDPLAPSAAFDKTFQSRLKQESRRHAAGFAEDEAEGDEDEAEDEEHRGEYDASLPPLGFFARLKRWVQFRCGVGPSLTAGVLQMAFAS